MGLFNKIFINKNPVREGLRCELVSDDSGFIKWEGKLYKSDIVMSAIRPKSQAVGKLTARHIINNNSKYNANINSWIKDILEFPNCLMSMQDFLTAMVIQRELNGNAFAYIEWDDTLTQINSISIMNVSSVELIEVGQDVYLRCIFENGKRADIPYTHVIHLRKDILPGKFFGANPLESLKNVMEVIDTSDKGLVKAVKSSSIFRWLLKFKNVLKDDDIDKEVLKFSKRYLDINNSKGGAAATDARYDIEQVKQDSYVPNAVQVDKTVLRVYSFFHVNEKIIQARYSEDEWNAFYESEIESIAQQLSNEFTRKIFTRRERGFGNRIIFDTTSLQYASMKTKLDLVHMVDRSSLEPNEWRRVLNLPPIEGGDKPLRRLDTAIAKEGKEVIDDGKKGINKSNGSENEQ